jgi:hypothetical protein
VYAKISATNAKGRSSTSSAGNDGIIITYPDPPISILEDTSTKTPTSIGMTWSEGPSNGGETVDDYRINIAEFGQSYSVLATGITSASYTATGLTTGITYDFKIESRNQHGYSDYSDVFTLQCSTIPDPPTIVTSSNSVD